MRYLSTLKNSFLGNAICVCLMTLLLFIAGTQTAEASHAMGADLTYSCINDDTYEITLTFYRDCSGTTAPTSPLINISSATCGQSSSLSLTQQGPPIEISPICDANISQSTCNGGTLQGVEQYTYTGIYTFPADCKDWILSYSLCCRNGAITNSTNPENFDIYVEALLNNLSVDCNNSPYFTTPPVPYICVGQPFNYNHGVIDAEGDSLVYSLVDPLNAPADPVPYQPGFSSLYPISTVSGLVTFDTETGQMGLTPDAVQIGIVAVLVQEYRDGQLIGSTIRDMQVVVISCNNNAPTVDLPTNISGGQFDGSTFQVCAGNTLSFDIDANDADPGDILNAIDNISSSIPNATLTLTGTNPLTASFNWPTTADDVGTYGFAITVEDDACPIVGFQVLGYEIFVPGVNIMAADTTICPGVIQDIQLDAIPFGSLTAGTFTWSPATGLDDPNLQNPTATVDQTTTYTVTYDDGVCIVSDEVEIVADGALVVTSDCSTGAGGGVQLQATYTATVPPAPPGCGISTGPCTGPYTTYDVGTDVTATGPSGTGNEAGSPYLGYYEDGRTQILYLAADLQAAGLVPGLISEAGFNVSTINSSQPYSGFTIKMGCTEMTTFANEFITGLDQVYTNGAVTPALGWNTYVLDAQYEWDGVSNLIVEVCYDNNSWTNYDHVFYSATTYNSVLYRRVDGSSGCNLNLPTASFNRPNIQLSNCEVDPPPPSVVFDWTPANGVDDPAIGNPIADPSVSTSYTVTVTTPDCSFTETIDISANGFSLTATGEDLGCGGTTGSINIDITGGNAPYTYDWSDSSLNGQEDPTGLLPGTYTVTVMDAAGCTGIVSADITTLASLDLTTAMTDVTCFGGTDGTAAITVGSGTAPFTYNWDGGLSATPTQNALSAGTYNITVTDVNDCESITSVTITEPTELTVATTGETLLCAGDTDGDISITAAGGTGTYTYTWDNGLPSTGVQTGLSAGTYTVTVSDASGCEVISTATISEPADALSVTSAGQDIPCAGDASGVIDLTVAGGTGTYTYIWDNSLPSTEDQAGLSGGTYNYTVSDANGCSLNGTVALTEPATPVVVTATGETLACPGDADGDISLTVNGGTGTYTYSWSNGPTTSSQNGLATGTYTVTVTDSNNCTAVTSAVIDVVNPVLITTVDGTVDCANDTDGSVSVTATGGTAPYTYVWDNGAPPVSNPTGLTSGTYNVTVFDANGCSVSDVASITAPNAVAITLSSTPVSCFGGNDGLATVTPTGGTPPYTYLWGNGQTLPTATSLIGGAVSIAVTDDAGCTIQASVTITEPAELVAAINASTMTSCFDSADGTATVVPAGGTPPYTYAWDNAETTATATSLSEGLHVVNILDDNGCAVQANVTVGAPAQIQLSIAGTDLDCFQGGDGSATVTVTSGGVAPYTYDWITGATTNNVNGLAAGTYTVDVIDTNGCVEQTSVTLTEPSEVVLIATLTNNASCFNTVDGGASVTGSGGVGGYTFTWDNGEIGSTAVGLAPGAHIVTGIDANGCEAIANVTISAPVAIATSLTSTPASCFGGDDGTATVTVTGGTPPFTYLWDDGQTIDAATGLSAGIQSVIITDANGCSTEETVQVDQPNSALATSLTPDAPSCFGEADGAIQTQTSGGTAPYTYTWSTGDTGNSISGVASGAYELTITDANNCQVIESASLVQPNAMQFSSVTTDVNCFGGDDGTITVNVAGGVGPYLYSLDGEDYIFSPTQIRLTAGSYTIYVQDDNGCIQTTSAVVNEPPELIVDIIDNTRINYGDSVILETSVNQIVPVTYSWNPTEDLSCDNCPNPVASPPSQTTYNVTVTTDDGCEADADVIVYINKERPVFIPSGFTPNGDQANDVFMVHGGSGVETLKAFRVFDRWGEAVFEVRDAPANNPEFGWNGDFRGQEMNPGVFTYYVEVVFEDGEVIPYSGDVTLIR